MAGLSPIRSHLPVARMLCEGGSPLAARLGFYPEDLLVRLFQVQFIPGEQFDVGRIVLDPPKLLRFSLVNQFLLLQLLFKGLES